MADTSFMARFGARLVTNGYAILPIGPGTKKPGRFQRGAWVDYPEWSRHAERGTTDVEVATWSSWPGCGLGILGGAVAAVDIDIIDDPDLALQIEQLARTRLGDTPALRIGRAPKRMRASCSICNARSASSMMSISTAATAPPRIPKPQSGQLDQVATSTSVVSRSAWRFHSG